MPRNLLTYLEVTRVLVNNLEGMLVSGSECTHASQSHVRVVKIYTMVLLCGGGENLKEPLSVFVMLSIMYVLC